MRRDYQRQFGGCNEKHSRIGKYNSHIPADIFLFKVNNRNTRKRCEICSELTI